jgi:hypothetical protein
LRIKIPKLAELPTAQEVQEMANNIFISHGNDPGEYQGFLAACEWLYNYVGYPILENKDGEWIWID